MSKQHQTIILQLYRLSKEGHLLKFVDLVESSQILRKLNNLDGFQSSMLIYAFYKLDIQQVDIWKSLEDLYLVNQKGMNIHDKIMCGWSFLNIVKNPVIWEQLQDTFKKSTSELIQQQEKSPNLGLLSYIMASRNILDPEFWSRIEWVYRQTQHLQDERNNTLVIYSFSRVNITSPAVWDMFEDILLKQGVTKFKFRNLMLIIYSYAKNEQGSDKLWEVFQDLIIKQQQFIRLDINFIQWAFGKMKKGKYEFWDFMIKETIKMWDEFHIHDIEMMLNAYRSAIYDQQFTQEQKNTLMQKIAKMRIIKVNAHRKRFSLIDEIVAIGRAMEATGLLESQLADSVSERFFEALPEFNFKEYKFRLWRFKFFFQHSQNKFDKYVQNQLIKKLYTEFNQIPGAIVNPLEEYTKAQNDLMIDLLVLGQSADCRDQAYWGQIAQIYLQINIDKVSSDNFENYSFNGLQIYLNIQDLKLKSQLILRLACRDSIHQNYGKVIIISCLKGLTYENPNLYLTNLLAYCKETHQMKFEYLNRIILVLLHKNNYQVSTDNYHLFRQDVEALYANNFEGISQKHKFIDIINQCFVHPQLIVMTVQDITTMLQPFSQKTLEFPSYVIEKMSNAEDIENQKFQLVKELTEDKMSIETEQADLSYQEKFDSNFSKYLGRDR